MTQLTLLRQGSYLAESSQQLRILEVQSEQQSFNDCLEDHGQAPLQATSIEVLQINVGKLCNQTCQHCHVDAGPDRREIMTRQTMQLCIDVLSKTQIPTVDITGGAPEMNPDFRWLVEQVRALDRHIIDRSNLTILLAPGFEYLPEFLADNKVEIVASLPCYLEENTDAQRGGGVFQRSIEALQKLNSLGYGAPESDLNLTLVFNPVGPSLPPQQSMLEDAYRRELKSRYDIEFNRLFTITNMPISRFLNDLIENGQYETYMDKLVEAFNPAAAKHVMCRTTLSVDWNGTLYDCDFNQMLQLGLDNQQPKHIRDFSEAKLRNRRIVVGQHCYGCTAGAGSSCQGAIA